MSEPLAIYLHDHLAGSTLALDLLDSMRKEHEGEPLGQFAQTLRAEIEADRDVLRTLAERIGPGSNPIKDLGAWMSEKVSRIKLGGQSGGDLTTFEALEFLMLGIHGKWALWRALAVVATTDARLQGTDFAHLMARAGTQEIQVEQRRMEAARTAFLSTA
jgi:hypothetical protein